MLLKKNYLLFLLLIFIILINKNIFAAPLCFEDEDNIENKEFTINIKRVRCFFFNIINKFNYFIF